MNMLTQVFILNCAYFLIALSNITLIQSNLLLSGDIERNPGPRKPKYPCGECNKACTSYKGAKASILCESCNVWFHSECVGLSDSALDNHGRSDLSWECCRCGLPNFSSGLFNSTELDGSSTEDTSNSNSQHSTSSTSSSHLGSPLAKSSPSFKTKSHQSFQDLRFLEVNFQSIFGKREEFWSVLDAVKPDVVFGCETWLKPEISNGEIFPPGFDIYRSDRRGGYGGVLLAVHSSLNNHQISIKTEAELVAAKIINNKQTIVVASFYRPTNNNVDYIVDLSSSTRHLCQDNPGAAVWFAGDINLPDINWETSSIISHQYRRTINETFLNLLESAGLEQMVDFPTRGDNTLDIILTNRPSLTNRCSGLPGLSDHDLVFMDANVQAGRRKPIRRKILLWNKADFDAIRSRAQQMSVNYTSSFNSSTPVDVLADALQQELDKIISDCVPSKMTSTRVNQPWFNSKTKRILRRKCRAFNKARRTNKARDWDRFKLLKKEAQKVCRNSYNNYVHDIIHSVPAGCRNKKLGALVKAKRCDNIGVAPLKDGGFLHSDPRSKANILNRQFSSVFSTDDGAPLPDLEDKEYPTMDNIKISENGVIKLLKNLKSFTASGPDGIPTMLLKRAAVEIAPAVTLLFQASISQGKVPSQWKKAQVVPLFKKGSRSDAANYRPISLTSVLCKLCEHIIHCAVINHLSDNNIISDAQHGFRKQRSCETQLLGMLDDLAKGLDMKSQIDVVLLDYEKAFDKVSHRHLMKKVQHYGICGVTADWISDFLHSRTQSVLVDGQESKESPVTSGVPQGSVLGPLLFLIFINDLPDCISSSSVRLYADDSVVYRHISSPDDSTRLQKDLDALQEWEVKWLMQFNATKCQVLQVTNKRKPIPASYTIHDHVLEVVSSTKYLGVHIDSKLNFNTHVDTITKKANGTRAFFSRNLHHSSQKVKEAVYSTFIRPIVEYAATSWDPHTQRNINKLEQVQRSAARFVMGDFERSSSVTAMLDHLKWPSLQERRFQSRLLLMYKIRHHLVDIHWQSYLTQLSTSTRGHSSRFTIPHSSTTVYASSFFPRTIRDWNNLPVDPAAYPSFIAFKSALKDLCRM